MLRGSHVLLFYIVYNSCGYFCIYQHCPVLFRRGQVRARSSGKDGIPEVVVTSNTLAMTSAADRMIATLIRKLHAGPLA